MCNWEPEYEDDYIDPYRRMLPEGGEAESVEKLMSILELNPD